MWDNAYAVHDLNDTPDHLLNLMDECRKNGSEDLPILFCSTSKITFPGSGVAAMAASESNMAVFKRKYQYQTIGYDKLNQLSMYAILEIIRGFWIICSFIGRF